jgi:hypothetical protein
MRRLYGQAAALALFASIPVSCLGQCVYRPISMSRVQGAVFGRSGEPISNADVSLVRDGSTIAETKTDGAGKFSVPAPSGKYELKAKAHGFAPGFAQVDVGNDLVRALRPTHLWMILDVGMTIENCTLTTTEKRRFKKAIQAHKQSN